MGTFKYTITTTTERCPHCGYVFSETVKGALDPIIAGCWPITLPIRIPYWLIKYCGFGNPVVPTVGEKIVTCPKCSMPVRTTDIKIEHMNAEQILNFKFQTWFRVAYVLGAVLSFSLILSIPGAVENPTVFYVMSILSFLGIGTIIAIYRIMKAKLYAPRENPPPVIKVTKDKATKKLFCRKCGKQLPLDSAFCNECGEKLITIVNCTQQKKEPIKTVSLDAFSGVRTRGCGTFHKGYGRPKIDASTNFVQKSMSNTYYNDDEHIECPHCRENLDFMGWNDEDLKKEQICPMCNKPFTK